MAARPKKAEPAHDDVGIPDWVLPDDHEKYVAAHNEGEIDAAGFGSREEYEGRTEMDKIAEAAESEKKPDPKPGDPDYDWTPHYPAGSELFWHTFPDGKVVALRVFGAIYSKAWLYKIRNLPTDTDFQFASIDRGACETAQEVLATVDAPIGADDPFEALWTAWVAADTAHDGSEGMSSGE